MKRREFITLLGGATASWPLAARAQKQPARIGFLGSGFAQSSAIFVDAVKEGLRENGLAEQRDYVFDVVWAEGNYKQFPPLAEELVRRKCRVILATTIIAVQASQHASATIPIVMATINDPVGAGLVASLARPGGNTTGISNLNQDLTPKLIELVEAIIPKATVIAALLNPANPSNRILFESTRTQAALIGLTIQPVELKAPRELDAIFDSLGKRRPDALMIIPDAMFLDARARIAVLALQHRLATVSSFPEFSDVGGLINYGASRRDLYRRSAYFIKRILDGEKAADLPVEQPTRVELSINLRTAKALGISIPDTLLARADRVIE